MVAWKLERLQNFKFKILNFAVRKPALVTLNWKKSSTHFDKNVLKIEFQICAFGLWPSCKFGRKQFVKFREICFRLLLFGVKFKWILLWQLVLDWKIVSVHNRFGLALRETVVLSLLLRFEIGNNLPFGNRIKIKSSSENITFSVLKYLECYHVHVWNFWFYFELLK